MGDAVVHEYAALWGLEINTPGIVVETLPSLDQGELDTLEIEIEAVDSYDKITVTGAAALDGTLSISLLSGYVPEAGDIFDTVIYYLRFSGYWLLVFLLLILSQIRSIRWGKAILRRLEII